MNASHIGDRSQRPKTKPRDDTPPQLSPVDIIIGAHDGSTTALEASRQQVQTSKHYPILSPSQEIRELQRRHGHLRAELAYYRELEGAIIEFSADMKRIERVLESVKQTVSRLGNAQRAAKQDWFQMRQSDKQYSD